MTAPIDDQVDADVDVDLTPKPVPEYDAGRIAVALIVLWSVGTLFVRYLLIPVAVLAFIAFLAYALLRY